MGKKKNKERKNVNKNRKETEKFAKETRKERRDREGRIEKSKGREKWRQRKASVRSNECLCELRGDVVHTRFMH